MAAKESKPADDFNPLLLLLFAKGETKLLFEFNEAESNPFLYPEANESKPELLLLF